MRVGEVLRFNVENYENLNKSKNTIKLDDILEVKGGKRIPKGEGYSFEITDYKYLRVDDIDANSFVDYSDLKYISEKIYSILKRYEVNSKDVIISIAGTIGKVHIVPEKIKNVILTENCAKLKIKSGVELIPEFLKLILESDNLQSQMKSTYIQTTIPKLCLDKIKNLQIPLPPLETQQKLVKMMDEAYNLKKSKEQKAKELLDSIDGFVMEELGVEKVESVEKKVFGVRLSDLSESRADVEFNLDKQTGLERALLKPKHPVEKIQNFVTFISGYAFKSLNYVENSQTKLLTIKNITSSGVSESNFTYLPDEYFDRYKNFQIKRGDLLFAMTGATIGKVCLFNLNDNVLLNQRVGAIRAKNINIMFLYSYLNLEIVKNDIIRRSVGGAQANISPTEILSIKIPLPPLEIQQKIADEVEKRRVEAFGLQSEAKEILERAKREFEVEVLG